MSNYNLNFKEFLKNINFPYENARNGQDIFLEKVYNNILLNKNLLVLAPTGLGKTISGLAPALKIAKEKNLSIIFLTSRQTQANQAIKTIKDIEIKRKLNFQNNYDKLNYLAFVGKRNMCCFDQKDLYPASDFNDFCKKMRETGKCEYYKNFKNSDYEETINDIIEKSSKEFMSVEDFINLCADYNFCPYEVAGKKSYKADVIICDFNYIFSLSIRENFLGKIGRDLNECILIVDEAHNLPDRIRNSYSFSLSTKIINQALQELKDFVKTDEYDFYIKNIQTTIEEIYFEKVLGDKTQYLVEDNEFLDSYLKKFNNRVSFLDIVDKLKEIEIKVKEQRIVSFIGRCANFLENWKNLEKDVYLRILEKNILKDETILNLKLMCIDPAKIASKSLNKSFSSILMSATLSPINMYKDILGVENCDILELDSPFKKKNQLTLVVDDVTTKYSLRSNQMFKKIAEHIRNILFLTLNKNAIVFFPSYDLMEKILAYVDLSNLDRQILKEQRFMSKEDKEKFVLNFKKRGGIFSKSKVLFAITSGSFSEGLDLPEKMLEVVIVVGLPLGIPSLYSNSVINYFDRKFKKGQMYGYIYPAMNKIIQAVGRCIRTTNDKGLIVLMDNRFFWPLYAQTFPKYWKLEKDKDNNFDSKILNFFDDK